MFLIKPSVIRYIIFLKCGKRPTAGFSGGLPREPTHETEKCFRAKKSRETERGKPSDCKHCSARLRRATLTLKILNLTAKLNKTQAAKNSHKNALSTFCSFSAEKKLIVPNLQNEKPILIAKVACNKPCHWLMTKNNPSAVLARTLPMKIALLRPMKSRADYCKFRLKL